MRAVILTALNTEYSAVQAHLSDLLEYTYKGTIYEVGKFSANGRSWDTAIAEIGPLNENASQEAERAINHFDPSVALFVGVAGGLKNVRIGDVVAATKIYGYESGKAEFEFLTRPEVYRSSYSIEQRARAVARRKVWAKRIKPFAPNSTPGTFIAPIAAGSKVVASTKSWIYNFIRSNYSDALAVEMEGLGFLSAAHANSDVEALVIRGISDLIDNKEEADIQGSQNLASQNAAAFAFEILANHGPIDPSPRGLYQEDLPPGLQLPSLGEILPAGRNSSTLQSVDGLADTLSGALGRRSGRSGRPRKRRPP